MNFKKKSIGKVLKLQPGSGSFPSLTRKLLGHSFNVIFVVSLTLRDNVRIY